MKKKTAMAQRTPRKETKIMKKKNKGLMLRKRTNLTTGGTKVRGFRDEIIE